MKRRVQPDEGHEIRRLNPICEIAVGVDPVGEEYAEILGGAIAGILREGLRRAVCVKLDHGPNLRRRRCEVGAGRSVEELIDSLSIRSDPTGWPVESH